MTEKAGFREAVFDIVRQIPAGQVLTYKQVARAAGSPRAARAVGNILKQNYNPNIPCHRVIMSNGQIGQYNRGVENKVKLLRQEGFLTS